MNFVHLLLKRTGIKKTNLHVITGLIILCLLIAPILTFAGEMYVCTDQDGNEIVTNAPREGMSNCVLKYPAEDSSSRMNIKSRDDDSPNVNIISKQEKRKKEEVMSKCNFLPRMMNMARDHLNQAAQKQWSELEKGRKDVRAAMSILDHAEKMSEDCQCPPLTTEIARAAEFTQKAYYAYSVDQFSDLLTKAIHAFNNAGKTYQYCK
jgi:hypothetical protein